MRTLDGSLAVVTGASRGIGEALALRLVARGATVIAVGRDEAGLSRLAATGGRRIVPVAADVTEAAGRARIRDAAGDTGRPIDILVNNAGVQNAIDLGGSGASAVPAIEREIAVNLTAPLALTAELLPRLRQPGGLVVNVTSLVALHPKASAPAYSASKAGLHSFTASLRNQLRPLGVDVAEVLPPLVDTAMTAGRGRRKLAADDMAAAILAGLERGDERIAPGAAGVVVMLNRVAPGLVARMLGKE